MESRPDAVEDLHRIERAEASQYVDYPPTPPWSPPAIEGGFLAWCERFHGAVPSLRNAPAEFGPLFGSYAAGSGVVLAVGVTLGCTSGPWVTAGVGAVVVTVGYERAYAATASRTRARLVSLA